MASRIVSSNPWPQRTPSYTSPESTPLFDPDESQYQMPLDDEDYSGHDSNNYDHKTYHSTNRPNKRSPPSRRQTADTATVTSDDCGLMPNNVLTCFPDANSVVIQGIPSRVVWNKFLPLFSQTNLIDVHLIHGDTDIPVLVWLSQQYQLGHLAFTPNDTWWGSKGPDIQPGQNQTQSFFFVLVPNGTDVNAGTSQATFTATQTSLPTSILVSLSAASASSLSASLASLSSESLASMVTSTTKPPISSSSPTSASLQGNSSGSNSFPNWAIALLSVFGFLAFLSLLCVLFLLFRGLKRKDRGMYERASTGGELKYRGSVGSNTPMIPRPTGAEAAFKEGPTLGADAPPSVGAGGTSQGLPIPGGAPHPMSDNGSTISHADSAYAPGAPPLSHSAVHPPPFSLTDATALGFAFRNVMRKPEFPDVDEGDAEGLRQSVVDDDAGREVLESELAEEGRDIQSVGSSRGVKIETVDSSTA